MSDYILVLDEGTTSTRAMLFASDGALVASAQEPLTQHYPQAGWVEHDPREIWDKTLACAQSLLAKAGGAAMIACIGITNQRETVVAWNRETGEPLTNAIVWQDRRSEPFCAELRDAGHEAGVQERTGLRLDPYFSGTKMRWMLDNVEQVRAAADAGTLAFGTVESWLVDWSAPEDRLLLDVATIGEVRRDDIAFTAELRSVAHIFDQPQGRAFQRNCSANIGDTHCKINLDAPAYSRQATVVSAQIDLLMTTRDHAVPDGFFTNGSARFDSGVNAGANLAIRSHRQDAGQTVIALWTPTGKLTQTGDTLSLTAGCDKRPETCQTTFSNIVNFRGFPHMPGNDRVIATPGAREVAMDGGSLYR